MKQVILKFKRLLLVVTALAFTGAFAFPALVSAPALAYNQPTSRSVQMSSSALGATSVQYTFQFTTSASDSGTTLVEGMVFNFCDDTPIIGNSCQYTSGATGSINIGSASLVSVTGTPDTTVGGSDWQISSNSNTATAGNGVILAITDSNAAESGTHYVAPGTTITVVVGGITNPNYAVGSCSTTPNCSFYARMLAFPTTAGATGYASQTIGAPSDAGGAALSTNSTISISATVMETLTFCVSGSSITGTCSGGLTTPSLIIGHGSPTATINSSATDITPAYSQLSTNAVHGATVYMKASNTCNGLSSNGGASCASIPGIGNSATAIPPGTADFGMCVAPGSATVTAPYQDTAHSCPTSWTSGELFGMSTTTTSTYGSSIYTESGAVASDNNKLNFAASASNTTPAGIYTAKEQLIATGVY
jgi:hypothetical protein